MREHTLRQQERGPAVQVQQRVPVLQRLLLEGQVDRDPRVVHQDVDRPEPGDGGGDQCLRARGRGQVGFDGDGGG